MRLLKAALGLAAALSITAALSCGSKDGAPKNGMRTVENIEYVPEPDEKKIPLTYADISGPWALKYDNNTGYDFIFNMNYKSVIVLSLNSESLVFKGVISIEDNDIIKVSIYEMKQEGRTGTLNLVTGFQKAKSSYFLFRAQITEKEKRRTLVLRPLNIIIDGRNSDGYFEPLMKLRRP